jgi:hypothetical protein
MPWAGLGVFVDGFGIVDVCWMVVGGLLVFARAWLGTTGGGGKIPGSLAGSMRHGP